MTTGWFGIEPQISDPADNFLARLAAVLERQEYGYQQTYLGRPSTCFLLKYTTFPWLKTLSRLSTARLQSTTGLLARDYLRHNDIAVRTQ